MSNYTLEELNEILFNEDGDLVVVTTANADQIWILLSGFLVFWMHAGFTMLEAGSVRMKNAVNILFKNLGTVSIGSIFYYLTGYAFAYGTENLDEVDGVPQVRDGSFRFIGSGSYAIHDFENTDRHTFFFQAVFAATAATIVSGAVAGRINLMAYFGIAIFLTGFVYPIVAHWIWQTGGWASAFTFEAQDPEDVLFGSDGCGMIDYAGSGVVHLTGGTAAFWAALVLGPRLGRFDSDGNAVEIRPHNITLQALGVFILWFGWYGFNCGSTLAFDGPNAAKAAVTTTLSAAMAVLTGMAVARRTEGHYDIGITLNCALAGLVGITAGCTVVDDWAAIVIGFVAAFVYIGASKGMKRLRIDDPVDAVAVHGACGIWGCLAVGIFGTPELILEAYSKECSGWNSGLQFGSQLVGVIAIICWVTLMILPLVVALKHAGVLRVPAEWEESGLDYSEHGGHVAFTPDHIEPTPPSRKADVADVAEEEQAAPTDTDAAAAVETATTSESVAQA